MPEYELQTEGTYYAGREWSRGDVIDFEGDDIDVKALLDAGHIAEVGTLEKQAKAAQDAETKAVQAEQAAADARRAVLEGNAPGPDDDTSPNVSSQDGPKTTRRAGK
jgi:hypothetical protein